MKKLEIRYSVVLTQTAIEELKNDPICIFLKKNKYFHCLSIDSSNPHYLGMVIELEPPFPRLDAQADISIPYHYVQYIVSAHQEKTLGFAEIESAFLEKKNLPS